MSLLEAIAVAVSFLGIWLTARRSMACWPVNVLACLLYFKVFLDVRLYADMVLQGLFAAGTAYGWIAWLRGVRDDGTVTVVPLRHGAAALAVAAGAAGAVAIGWGFARYTDAALPWADATLTSFSLVGQLWTARRHAESWLLWIVVDLCYVVLFVIKGLWLTTGLYAAMIVLAIHGWRQWRASPVAAFDQA